VEETEEVIGWGEWRRGPSVIDEHDVNAFNFWGWPGYPVFRVPFQANLFHFSTVGLVARQMNFIL
jgi:hypothetical protein